MTNVRSKAKVALALGAAALLGVGLSVAVPMTARADDLTIGTNGDTVKLGQTAWFGISGCGAKGASLVVTVEDGLGHSKEVPLKGGEKVAFEFVAPTAGKWSVSAVCLSYSGKLIFKASTGLAVVGPGDSSLPSTGN